MARTRESDRAEDGADDDNEEFDLNYLSGYSSGEHSVYTTSDEGDEERGGQHHRVINNEKVTSELGLVVDSNQTVNSATYISPDLLMLPTVNHVAPTKHEKQSPEQPPEQARVFRKQKSYTYQVPLLDCHVFPRFIRTAPVWLKLLMVICICTVLFGLCLYMAAALLQASNENDDGSSSSSDDNSASEILLQQDQDLLEWTATQTTLAPSATGTPSLAAWAQDMHPGHRPPP